MPTFVIYGMPTSIEAANEVAWLPGDLAEVVEAIPELKLTHDQISVFLPGDCVPEGLGEELVCFVEGLFVKPDRTPEVRKKLADAIKEKLVSFASVYIPQCRRVEVFVKQFNPDKDGFASGNPLDKS